MARGSKVKTDGSLGGPGERMSLYFPKGTLDEIKEEALTQDRSLSWLIQQAWAIARLRVSSKSRTRLLDSWIASKAWTLRSPKLEEILDVGEIDAGVPVRRKV